MCRSTSVGDVAVQLGPHVVGELAQVEDVRRCQASQRIGLVQALASQYFGGDALEFGREGLRIDVHGIGKSNAGREEGRDVQTVAVDGCRCGGTDARPLVSEEACERSSRRNQVAVAARSLHRPAGQTARSGGGRGSFAPRGTVTGPAPVRVPSPSTSSTRTRRRSRTRGSPSTCSDPAGLAAARAALRERLGEARPLRQEDRAVERYADFDLTPDASGGGFQFAWYADEPDFAIPERSAAENARLTDDLAAIADAGWTRQAIEARFGKLTPNPGSDEDRIERELWSLEFEPAGAAKPERVHIAFRRPLQGADLIRRLGIEEPRITAGDTH